MLSQACANLLQPTTRGCARIAHSSRSFATFQARPAAARHSAWKAPGPRRAHLAVRAMADDLQAMLVAKNTENSVIVYSKTTCPYCSEVKSLLGGLGVAAKVVELNELADGPAVQAALQQLTGRRTVPQVFIGGALVGGCDDTTAAYRSGKLAELLQGVGITLSQ